MKEVILILLGMCFHISTPARNLFTNIWAVKTFAGEEFARNISQLYRFSFQGLATSFDDHYIFRLDTLGNTTDVNMANITKKLMEHDEIMWAEQLKVKPLTYELRPRRGDKGKSGSKGEEADTLHRSFRATTHQGPAPRRDTVQQQQPTVPATSYSSRQTYPGPTRNIGLFSKKTSTYGSQFRDPLWMYQWYAHDYRTTYGPVMDHNLVPVYRSIDGRGRPITGEGVTVAIVDEGVDANHPDLKHSVLPDLSYNFLSDISGHSTGQRHGTLSAGVVAMAANNMHCGVGIAYGAKIAGLKVLGGGDPTDYTLGAALGFARDFIDIYSASLFLDTEGEKIVKSSHMEQESIRTGVRIGRQGKGSIYVLAAGNSKTLGDSCAFQEISNQKDIILIGSATNQGKMTRYSEACPNVFATTYSGADYGEGLVTTKVDGGCTSTFGGTSASVPIASGIIALVLQANPNLKYRDIQHLITMSAEVAPLANNPGTWQQNKAGFWVSQDFGFGLMNAQNMVDLARGWTNVQPQVTCEGKLNFNPAKQFSSAQPYTLIFGIDACVNTNSAITFLERVTLTFDISYPGRRGDLFISLTSPKGADGRGTEVVMVRTRSKDNSRNGFKDWSVTSVQTWGENPNGDWIITIRNKNNQAAAEAESSTSGNKRKDRSSSKEIIGLIFSLKLTFHGLARRPGHMAYGPRRNYAGFRLG